MRRFLLALLLLAWSVAPASAQRTTRYEAIAVSSSAVSIDAATLVDMNACVVVIEEEDIRWRLDGTDPTGSVGTLMKVGSVITLTNITDARLSRFIRAGALDAALSVTCYPSAGEIMLSGSGGAAAGEITGEVTTNLTLQEADDGSIAGGQTADAVIGFTMAFDGTVWRRLTFGTAGTPSAQVLTVQGISSGTPLDVAVTGTVDLGSTDNGVLDAIAADTAFLEPLIAPIDPDTASATTALVVGGTYNSAGVTLTNGQQAGAQLDGAGHLLVANADMLTELSGIGDALEAGVNIKINDADPLPEATSATLQNAATADGNGTLLTVSGYASVVSTLNCSSCGGGTTVNWEASEDGTNFVAVPAQLQTAPYTIASTTTTAGLTYWRIPVNGYQHLRARISSYSAGTITVTGRAIFASAPLNVALLDPCKTEVQTTDTISVIADTVMIAAATGKKNFLCSVKVNANAAETVSIWEGTGSTCGTSSVALDGNTTEANGNLLGAGGGWVMTGGSGPVISGKTASSDMCVRLSGTSRVVVTYSWVQR